jgi:DNA mismatch endonuclease (patch repair protein)
MKTTSFIERAVFNELQKLDGYTFEHQASDLPGTPDIVERERKLAIFVNGCYWHGHSCLQTSRAEYKVEHELAVIEKLKSNGYDILILWECDLSSNFYMCINRVINYLEKSSHD